MAHDVKEWRRGHVARLTKETAVRRLGKMASIGMIRPFWHSCDGGKVNFPRALAGRGGHGCRHRRDGRSGRHAGLLVPGGINGPYPAADKRNALCLRRSWRRCAVLVMECRDADAQRHDAEVRRGCGHREGGGKTRFGRLGSGWHGRHIDRSSHSGIVCDCVAGRPSPWTMTPCRRTFHASSSLPLQRHRAACPRDEGMPFHAIAAVADVLADAFEI